MLIGILTSVPVTASALAAGDLGTGVYWSYDSDTGTLHLSGDGEIPFYDTQPDIPWWSYKNEIKHVLMEEGITTVASLEKLTQLKEISLPDSVTTIGSSAFYGCYSLETVNLPQNITSISNHAFDSCESLKNFTINGGTNGKGSPFTDSSGNITGDGYFVRDGVLFANYNTYVDNNLCIKKINHNTLVKYPSGRQETNYTIPSTTMEIGSDAFSSVKNLQTITIPSSVVSFYVRSFVGYGEAFEQPLTLIFQHNIYPKDMARSSLRNLVSGSKVIVKNEIVKKVFAEKSSYFIYNSDGAQNVTIVADPTPTTNLTISSAPKTLNINESDVVEVTQTPYKTTDNINFTSSDEAIISFDKYGCGQITANGVGTVTLTVTSGSVEEKFTVTVTCEHPSSHIANTSEATCTRDGYTGDIVCDKCDSILTKGSVIPASGHKYGEWRVICSARCDRDGAKRRQCAVCPHMQTETIPATEHNYVSVPAQPATCTQNGYTSGVYCSVCNQVSTPTTSIPARGHTVVKDPAIEATCTTAGKTEGSHCSVCNIVIVAQTTIPAGHRIVVGDWMIDKEATCTEDGYKHHECYLCGEVFDKETIKATGHTSSNWIIDKDATLNEEGSKHKECTVCGEVLETATIPQLKCATPKLTKGANTASGVKVTWDAVEGADSYRVYRRAGGVRTWSFIGTTNDTSFTDAKATNNKYWIYTVIAVNEAGYSGFDKVGKTIKCVTAPKVTGVSNVANGLYVKWNAVPGAKEYRVYRKGLNYKTWMYVGTTKNTWFTDSPIKNSNGYYYKYTVIAVNDYYSGFYENCAFTKRLSNPVLKSAVSSKTGITVKWNSVYGSTGYYVYRKTANSGWTLVGSTKGANSATYIDKTAKKGVTYTYTVRAYHGKTFSSYNSGISCKDKY